MNKTTLKLVKTVLACTIVLASFTACEAKEVECNIAGEHLHLYVNEGSKLSRYIKSEKEYIGDLLRTDSYLPITEELKNIDINELYCISENIEYIQNQISSHQPKREEYSYEYVYGTYYGYGLGYNYSSGKYDYSYGLKTGYHWDYVWQEIPMNEYTTNKVRDTNYQFRLYKINEDGTISSQLFTSLDEVTEEYKYFKPSTFIKESTTDSYYLDKNKQKTKTNE